MSKAVKVLLVGAAAVGCVLTAGAPASAEVSAAPSCVIDVSANRNSIAARCSSGPGTEFAAAIQCDNASGVRLGPWRKYGSTYSAVGCLGSGKIVGSQYGVATR
ncbi:hypothetical protein [Amycolatopsis keratiniphila]|uniref:hypothetical protein n=1 Tax=Amycolatopsis keratiniphila TaxID=129921 RepID=UPI00087B3E3C|nr:hypothetical protein [Amycolatopsis keratiniphila]OLZ47151.1 hypothetical protein BS330_35405 [Amycolatopsis keratiniphila subsp. nogabecina]SDU00155.1 hypothetical protein SAMN04489733_0271 [Amycolatopsis keratiniphila]